MKDSPLFRAFPLGGLRQTSCGEQPVPYHVYDGRAFLLGGTVQGTAAQAALAGQDARPILNHNRQALATLWVCQFSEASLGAHVELQFSLAVVRREIPAVDAHPFELLRLIAAEPQLRLFPLRLWNDTERVVAYNREVLGLDARLCQARFDRQARRTAFQFNNTAGDAILSGSFENARRQPSGDGWRLAQKFGLNGMRKLAEMPWISAQLMTPAGVIFARNAESQAYLHAAQTCITVFDCKREQLEIEESTLRAIDFRPEFIEAMDGFEFVYLPPYNL